MSPFSILEKKTPNKFNIWSHWLESVWAAYCRITSVFRIASVFGIKFQIEVGQYLGSKLSRSVFGIEVEIEIDSI